MKEQYHCRTASVNEVNLMLDWARIEGWNPGLNDGLPFFVTDPAGFFIGELNHKPIATISAIRYSNSFGFIGLYIVAPEHRGKGYGLALWQHGMKYLAGCNIGLDAVISSQERYKKSGFNRAHENIRFSGVIPKQTSHSPALLPIKELPFDKLLTYDQQIVPAPRPAFIAAWACMPDSYGLAAIKDGELHGYSVIRKCIEGYKVGPLFANDYETAEQLVLALANYANQNTISLDITDRNKAAMKIVEQLNMKPVFTTARMYTQGEPNIDLNKVYGITTFELG